MMAVARLFASVPLFVLFINVPEFEFVHPFDPLLTAVMTSELLP